MDIWRIVFIYGHFNCIMRLVLLFILSLIMVDNESLKQQQPDENSFQTCRVVDCQRVSKDSCRTLLKQYFLCRAIAEYYGDTKDVSCSVILDIAPYSLEAFVHVNKYAQQFVESVEPCAVEDLGYGKAFILQCIDKYNSKELDDFIKQMDRFCYYYHAKRNVSQKE